MGSELNKLKALYGVSTPTIAAYTGATNPGAAPIAPALGATAEQQAKYAADKAAFDEAARKYNVDRTAYDQYTGEYKNRMANTNMYNQNQFNTTGANVPPFMSFGDQPMPPPPPVNQPGFGQIFGQSVMPTAMQSGMGQNFAPPPPPNTMNTGTQYGQPQWSNTLTAPQYTYGSDSYIPPVADVGTVPNVNTGSTGNTGGTTGFLQTAIDLKNNPSDQGLKDLFMSYLPGVLGLPQGFENQNRSEGSGRDRDYTDNASVSSAPSSGGYTGLSDMFDGGGPGQSGSGGGGYTGLRDMFDGGGPGQSGSGGGGYTGLRDMFDGGGPGQSGSGSKSAKKYAEGGQVRGFFQGGTEGVPIEEIATSAIDSAETPEAGMTGVQSLLDKYYPAGGDYAGDVKSARAKADAESVAFMDLMKGYMQNPESARSSKAEMYFRLAAAFGSPTKTGAFGENLALANTELADYAKGQRATAAEQLQLQMEMQKMKMQGAKEDLVAARDLATTDMSNRRAIASDLIKEYIASGKPQSAAGKTAMDLGFKPGTPEYDAKVKELVQLDIDKAAAEIAAAQTRATDPASPFGKTVMDMGYKPGTLEFETEVKRLADQDAARVAALTEAALAGTAVKEKGLDQMTAPEVALRTETENKISSLDTALGAVSEAYSLNPKSFPGGWMGQAQRLAFESLNPSDERVIATSRINSLLQEQALNQLKTVFGGNPTEGERAILLEIQGIGAKSLEERAQIMKRTYEILQSRKAAEVKRLEDIKSGAYRTYDTTEVAP